MKKWEQNILIFDLDGTLTDSAEGIFRSAQYMQEKMGMPIWSEDELGFMIGPPLSYSFHNVMGLDEAQTQQAISIFRERYFALGLFENRVYDGIKEALIELKKMGKRLAVATSKHHSTAIRILKHFDLAQYFDMICGDEPGAGRDNKTKVIAYALEEMHADTNDVVMIGDRKYDIEGAHALGLPAIGVLYGYGSTEEFAQCHTEATVETPQALVALFQ